jgi:diguanylate cyclase (GGDEF)-like protein/putative nucleotidyltransferase with HDIG domain
MPKQQQKESMALYRSFVASVIGIGVVVTIAGTVPWQAQDPFRGYFFLALAIASSVLRLQTPQVVGTMTANFVFVLLGILELSLSEALLLGCASTAAQLLVHRKSARLPVTPVFHVANAAIAVTLAFRACHAPWMEATPERSLISLLLAATVLYAMNTFPVAVVVALLQKQNLAFVWRECNFRLFPHYLGGALLAGVFHYSTRSFGTQSPLLLVPLAFLAYSSFNAFRLRKDQGRSKGGELAGLHQRTIEALAMAIEAKDMKTQSHLLRLQLYCTEIGKDLRLPPEQMEALSAAAILHDIGKLAVPEHILSKPGKLTREEFEKVKIHATVGADILERVRFPYPVADIVRAHHEKWNGGGYPGGLKGEAIPLGARILAVADCLDALVSERPYHGAVSIDEAMNRLSAEAGVGFDPKVVRAFEARYEEIEERLKAEIANPALQLEHNPVHDSLFPSSEERTAPVSNSSPGNGHGYLDTIAAARQEAQVLLELSQQLGNSLQLDETLAVASSGLRRLVPFDSLAVYVTRGSDLLPRYATGESTSLFLSRQLTLGQGVAGWVAMHGKPILNGNPSVETGAHNDSGRSVVLNSAVAVPLHGGKEIVGVLMVCRRGFDSFNKDSLRLLLAVAGKLGTFIENALKYEQAAACASTDFLTGLPNARSLNLQLESELARSHRQATALTVLVADLDGFKDVNDRHGHLEGDAVLRAIARVLRDHCREYDFVARMGGDEFVVLLPGMAEADVVAKIAQLNKAVGEAGRRVVADSQLGLSIGQARFPVDGSTAEQLLAEADQRMYAVKTMRKMNRGGPAAGRGFDFDWMATTDSGR